MNKAKRNKGFTTAEMMVSGGVLLAVTFLTFDVMLTNAKISSQGVKAASAESTQRSGIELLQEDILISSAALIDAKNAGKFEAKNDKTLVLSQPIYDNAGVVVPGKNKVIVYDLQEIKGKPCVVRFAGIQVGTNPFTLAQTNIIAENVKKFNYRLAKSASFTPTGGLLTLPGTVVSNEPSSGKIRPLKIKALKPAIAKENDIQDSSKRGLTSGEMTSINLSITLASLTASLTSPLSSVDVLYEVDEKSTPNADLTINADNVKIWITVKGHDSMPDTTLTATGMMRNAK